MIIYHTHTCIYIYTHIYTHIYIYITPVWYAWLKSLGWSLELKSSNLFRDFSQGKFDV